MMTADNRMDGSHATPKAPRKEQHGGGDAEPSRKELELAKAVAEAKRTNSDKGLTSAQVAEKRAEVRCGARKARRARRGARGAARVSPGPVVSAPANPPSLPPASALSRRSLPAARAVRLQ